MNPAAILREASDAAFDLAISSNRFLQRLLADPQYALRQRTTVLATAISSAPANSLVPAGVSLVSEPPAIVVQTFVQAGKRFERLSEARQEQAQRELYERLKARQIALGTYRMGDPDDPQEEFAFADEAS